MKHRLLLVLAFFASSAVANVVFAEDVLDKIYGEGVHAYFAGDLAAAEESLQSAIDQDLRDPRAYYFLGLTKLQLGDAEGADEQFAAGASLETKSLSRFYAVSKSLERVQGAARRQIEKHRTRARALALQDRERERKLRYEELRDAESDVTMQSPGRGTPAEPEDDRQPTDAENEAAATTTPESEPERPAESDPFEESSSEPEADAAVSE